MANPFISNGTCYIGPSVRADASFIPCGNDAYGHKTCCGINDVCLSSKACYNSAFGITYLLGCSDPEYKDSNCPKKGAFPDNPWLGLSYCNGSSNKWVACSQKAKPATLTKPDYCYCPETSQNVAFLDKSTLENMATLPAAVGASVKWETGYFPTAVVPSTSQAPQNPTASSASTGTPPSQTGQPAPLSEESGLSSSSKIGIGAGVGIAGTLAAVAGMFFFLRHRRHNSKGQAALPVTDDVHQEREPGTASHPTPQPTNSSVVPGTPGTPGTVAVSELEHTAQRPWSIRSELDHSKVTSMGEAVHTESKQDGNITRGSSPAQPVSPSTGFSPPSRFASRFAMELPG